MRRIPSLLLAVLSGLAATLPAQGTQSLRGVWKPVEVVVNKGPYAGRHTTDVQPGLAIYTDTHYSLIYVQGFEPRPNLSENPTDEERGRIYGPFTAQAGTYQLRDSVLTRTPVVAKVPAVMTANTYTSRVRVVADTMWLIATAADTIETRAKWVRIER